MRSEVKKRLASFKKQSDMGTEQGYDIASGLIYSSENLEEVERYAKELTDWIMKMYEWTYRVVEMGVLQKIEIIKARMDQFASEVAGAIEEYINRWKEGDVPRANFPADMNVGLMTGWLEGYQPGNMKVFLKEIKESLVEGWVDHFERGVEEGDITMRDRDTMKNLFESLLVKEN